MGYPTSWGFIKGRLLAMVAIFAVLLIAGATWVLWGPEPISDGVYPPLFTQIEPANGALIRSREVWVRWSPRGEATGRVLWRRAGKGGFISVDANEGNPLIARLGPLEDGAKYEYIVEQKAEDLVQRSGMRTFSIQASLAFDPPTVEQTIQRDYDQRVKLTLRNHSKERIAVGAKAVATFDDLQADIVGPGSVDDPVELAPGGTLDLRLAVFAPDATHETYEIPIEAAGAFGLARVQVKRPKFDLSFRVLEERPATLAKTVEIRNQGDSLGDLALRVVPPNDAELRLDPGISHAHLQAGQSLTLVASPVLYLEFQELKAELEASAGGQKVKFPLVFKASPGQRLIGVRGSSFWSILCHLKLCTNDPDTCNDCPAPPGQGPVKPFLPAVDIMSEHAEVLGERSTALASTKPTAADFGFVHSFNAGEVIEPGTRFAPPGTEPGRASFKPVNFALSSEVQSSGTGYHAYWDTAQINGAGFSEVRQVSSGTVENRSASPISQTPQDPHKNSDDQENEAGHSNFQPKASDCKNRDCSSREIERRYSKARKLYKRYWSHVEMHERSLEGVRWAEKELNQPPARKSGRVPQAGPQYDWDSDSLVHWRSSYQYDAKRKLELLEGAMMRYSSHKKESYERCGILLPELWQTAPENSLRPLNACVVRCRENYKDASTYELGRKGLPEKFSELPRDVQTKKCRAFCERNQAQHDKDSSAFGWVDPTNGILSEIEQSNYDREISFKDEVALDPPSQNFKHLVQPKEVGLPIPSSLTKLERLGLEALIAHRWRLEFLEAWLGSYERGQGARLANDSEAMLRQAKAMTRYAALALTASREWASKWHKFLRNALENLDTSLVAPGGSRFASQDIVQRARERILRKEISAGERELMLAAKVSAFHLEKHRRRLENTSFEDTRSAIGRLSVEVELATPSDENTEIHESDMTWPEPYDLAGLTDYQELSRQLLGEAQDLVNSNEWTGEYTGTVLRPGILEALRRRATFTRDHRGPFAAPSDGELPDSSDLAAGWHAADRVFFAWHQPEDEILFVAFDPRGELLMAPQVIGNGRWPRLTVAGQRTAVAWQRGGEFRVRVYDGKGWGDECTLSGKEAAIALAQEGALYAATSTGLWRLGNDRFEIFQKGSYSLPAIAIDRKGQPQVACGEGGRIRLGDSDLGPGEQPSIAVTPDGTVHLAYLSNGKVVIRSRTANKWSDPRLISAKNPASPTLAVGSDGVRLSYLGAAQRGPEALWLVRESDKEPVLVPSLAGNVTDAWFMQQFSLRSPRSSYRRHDVLVTVNDVWVKYFQNTVPQGRFLFRMNPAHIFTSSGRPAWNRIATKSWHLNGGSYSTLSNYQIFVRTAWSELYAFASSSEEVLQAGSFGLKRDLPDLVLLANGLDLPIKKPRPGVLNLPVTLANLGEVDSQPAQLKLTGVRGKLLAAAQIPRIKSGELWTTSLPLDYDGRLELIRMDVVQSKADAEPDNDWMTMRLWEPPAGAVGPTGTVVVRGSGHANFAVFDLTGKRVRWRRTNNEVELSPGFYELELKGVRLPLSVDAGESVVLETGFLQVLGKGGSFYSVYDASGRRLSGHQTGSTGREFLPGDYEVEFRGQRLPTKIEAGRTTLVAETGSLQVVGTGSFYSIYDASGKRVANPQTGATVELLPGQYVIKMGERELTAEVKPGEKAVITP